MNATVKLEGARAFVSSFWDKAINDFLDGESAVPVPLRDWFKCYSGAGAARADEKALPEPFLGSLDVLAFSSRAVDLAKGKKPSPCFAPAIPA